MDRRGKVKIAVLLKIITGVLIGPAFCLALGAWGCCDTLSLRLGRIAGFLDGVAQVSVAVDIDVLVEVELSGEVGDFANVPSFAAQEVGLDLIWGTTLYGEGDYDLDEDARDEPLRVIAGWADLGPSYPLVFVAWKGDRYTLDRDICYLGWIDDQKSHLAGAYCGDSRAAMHCSQLLDGTNEPECQLCTAAYDCQLCDMKGKIEDCLPDKPGGASMDIDIDIDIDMDIDLDIDFDMDQNSTSALSI